MSNIKGSHDNLLFVHYQLFLLEEFRTSTVKRAKSSPPDVINTLINYFRKIDQVAMEFDQYLWLIAKNAVELIKLGNSAAGKSRRTSYLPFTLVFRMVKVIEMEEDADKEISANESESLSKRASFHPKDHTFSHLIKPRGIKNYRTKFFDVSRDVIEKQFRSIQDTREDDLSGILSGFDDLVQDLIQVADELVPCFPARYNIFQFYVLEYHRNVYSIIKQIIKSVTDAGAILLLLKWVRDYYHGIDMIPLSYV